MPKEMSIKVARAYIEATNAYDYEAVHALRAENFRGETNGEEVSRKQAAINDQLGLEAFPDFQLEAQLMVADGDYVVMNWIGHCTHLGPLNTSFGVVESTGKRIELSGSSTFKVKNGKIKRAWEYYNTELILKEAGLEISS
jgi:steroid delta-isomerase-like uncharacterized protein